jgi:hypothetical protein
MDAGANGLRVEVFDDWWSVGHLLLGGLDVGNWVKLEVQVPDMLDSSKRNVKIYSWDGSVYNILVGGDTEDNNPSPDWYNPVLFMDGSTGQGVYGSGKNPYTIYYKSQRGETANNIYNFGLTPPSTITYSQTYGCLKRVGFAIKMPPWTGSDDLSGRFAINKTKLKIEVDYEKEETSFIA